MSTPKVSVGVGIALSIFLRSSIFKTHVIYILFYDISIFVLVLKFARDTPHLHTDQASSDIRSLGKCTMFIPWLWIPVESRHQSLKSMIEEMWLPLWKWNANQGREVLLKATLGWRKASLLLLLLPVATLIAPSVEILVWTSWMNCLFSGSP